MHVRCRTFLFGTSAPIPFLALFAIAFGLPDEIQHWSLFSAPNLGAVPGEQRHRPSNCLLREYLERHALSLYSKNNPPRIPHAAEFFARFSLNETFWAPYAAARKSYSINLFLSSASAIWALVGLRPPPEDWLNEGAVYLIATLFLSLLYLTSRAYTPSTFPVRLRGWRRQLETTLFGFISRHWLAIAVTVISQIILYHFLLEFSESNPIIAFSF